MRLDLVQLAIAGALHSWATVSVFHHKGVLVDASESSARYHFYPDHVDRVGVRGLFVVDTTTWSCRILESTDHPQEERWVSALAHKIKRSFDGSGELPGTVFFIA